MTANLAQVDPVFDLPAILKPPLESQVLKRSEKDGIVLEEVKFHSHMDGAKRIDIFALFAYPRGAKKAPAFVWNQGGLYQATPYWPEFGAKRGYATLCIDFPIPGYRSTGGFPINSDVLLPDNPRAAPIYHGAVALLRAVSFLQSRTEVDAERIGMAGSSWGGFFTTLMVGLDPRLKVGSSMFGAGSMHLGNAWWDGQGPNPKRDDAFRARWLKTLDPATRLARSKTPIAWFTGTNDSFYWLPAAFDSHTRAAGPKHIALLPNWNHALTPPLDEQVFTWLDIHLKGATPFLACSTLKRTGNRVEWTYAGQRKRARAELLVSYGPPGNWHHRPWNVIAAEVDGDRCTTTLPPSSLPGFLIGSITDADGFRSATNMDFVDGVTSSPLPNWNGCEPWGGFERAHAEFRQLHGLPLPPRVSESFAGNQAVRIAEKKTVLGPIHFVPGVGQRLSLQMKAGKPTRVRLSLSGRFDGKTHEPPPLEVMATTQWTEASLAFTPPAVLSGSLSLVIVLEEPGAILLDEIRFQPSKEFR